jgi:hypothetical protein
MSKLNSLRILKQQSYGLPVIENKKKDKSMIFFKGSKVSIRFVRNGYFLVKEQGILAKHITKSTNWLILKNKKGHVLLKFALSSPILFKVNRIF